ncbi:MAG: hypothetical protein IKX19_09160 [Clostridia bacterium]|nr:hypothetical protein [Clostridia bacterium]
MLKQCERFGYIRTEQPHGSLFIYPISCSAIVAVVAEIGRVDEKVSGNGRIGGYLIAVCREESGKSAGERVAGIREKDRHGISPSERQFFAEPVG